MPSVFNFKNLPPVTPGRGEWIAKFPGFAVDDGRKLDSPDSNAGTTGWVDAPATSHVHSFTFFDARTVKGPRQIVAWAYLHSPLVAGRSVLGVKFKPTERVGITWYQYFFIDHVKGQDIFQAMSIAAHPWGEVGYPRLVEGGIPYRRVT